MSRVTHYYEKPKMWMCPKNGDASKVLQNWEVHHSPFQKNAAWGGECHISWKTLCHVNCDVLNHEFVWLPFTLVRQTHIQLEWLEICYVKFWLECTMHWILVWYVFGFQSPLVFVASEPQVTVTSETCDNVSVGSIRIVRTEPRVALLCQYNYPLVINHGNKGNRRFKNWESINGGCSIAMLDSRRVYQLFNVLILSDRSCNLATSHFHRRWLRGLGAQAEYPLVI